MHYVFLGLETRIEFLSRSYQKNPDGASEVDAYYFDKCDAQLNTSINEKDKNRWK